MLPFLQKIIDSKSREETKRICDNEIVVTGCGDALENWRLMLLWMILFFLCKKINFL